MRKPRILSTLTILMVSASLVTPTALFAQHCPGGPGEGGTCADYRALVSDYCGVGREITMYATQVEDVRSSSYCCINCYNKHCNYTSYTCNHHGEVSCNIYNDEHGGSIKTFNDPPTSFYVISGCTTDMSRCAGCGDY